MDLNPYIAGGIGIAGTLLGVIFTYRLARKLTDANAAHASRQAEVNALRDAKTKLRTSFAPAIALIYLARHHGTHDVPLVGDVLKNSLMTHASAVEEFRPFASNSAAYQEAWDQYRKTVRQDNSSIDTAEWGTSAPAWSSIEEKIHVILAFAKT